MKFKSQCSIRTVLISIAIIALVVAAAMALRNRGLAADDLDRILNGDDTISIQRFRIEFQQRIVDCTDHSTTKYLSEMMRQPLIPASGSGYTYYFTFDFSTGRTYELYGNVGASQFSLSVPSFQPHDAGFPTHDVILETPVPNPIEEIFAFLVAPWEEVGGLSLHVRDDQTLQYEYRPSLHGGNPRGTRTQELLDSNQ